MMRRANEPGRGNEDKKRRVDGGEGGEGGFAGKYFFFWSLSRLRRSPRQ